MPKLDFGIQIEPQYGFTYDMILGIAQQCESQGFESIWISDHFFMTDDSIGIPCLDCWTTMTGLARDTKKLRIGPMVMSQNYRNPALLAKMATTIDHLSNGRFYFGIGAGWKEVEYKAYGYPFPEPAIRIRQLRETIEIAKRMWTEDKPSFKGKYYSINEALCFPKPVQKPHIPVWVGGSGNYTLKVAARHANAINFSWSMPYATFKQKLAVLRDHCSAVKRDYNSIRKSAGLMITMAKTKRELDEDLRDQERRKDTPYMRYLNRQPPNIVGTPEVIAEKIREYYPLGVDHFILRFHFGDELESMNLFVDQVKKLL